MRFKPIGSGFGGRKIRTDDDYRRVLLRRQRFFIGMLIIGIFTGAIAACAEFLEWDVTLSSHTLGFYSGVGTGLSFGAIVLLVRLRRTLKNDEFLRKARIRETDERTQDINRRALAVAGYALLIAVYLICIIGGLFYPQLLTVLGVLACVFLMTYVISCFIYNKIM